MFQEEESKTAPIHQFKLKHDLKDVNYAFDSFMDTVINRVKEIEYTGSNKDSKDILKSINHTVEICYKEYYNLTQEIANPSYTNRPSLELCRFAIKIALNNYDIIDNKIHLHYKTSNKTFAPLIYKLHNLFTKLSTIKNEHKPTKEQMVELENIINNKADQLLTMHTELNKADTEKENVDLSNKMLELLDNTTYTFDKKLFLYVQKKIKYTIEQTAKLDQAHFNTLLENLNSNQQQKLSANINTFKNHYPKTCSDYLQKIKALSSTMRFHNKYESVIDLENEFNKEIHKIRQQFTADIEEEAKHNHDLSKMLIENAAIIEHATIIDIQHALDTHTKFKQLVEYAVQKRPQDLKAKNHLNEKLETLTTKYNAIIYNSFQPSQEVIKNLHKSYTKQSEAIIKYLRKHQIPEPTTAKSTLNKVEDVQHYNNNSPIVPFALSNQSYAPTSLSLVSNKPENAETYEAVTSYLKNKQKALEPQKTQITTPTTLDIKKTHLAPVYEVATLLGSVEQSNHHLALETLTFIGKGFEKYALKNNMMGIIASYLGVNTRPSEVPGHIEFELMFRGFQQPKNLPTAITASSLCLLNKNTAINPGIAGIEENKNIEPLIHEIIDAQLTLGSLLKPEMETTREERMQAFVWNPFKTIKESVKKHLEANTKIVAQVLDARGNSFAHKLIVNYNYHDELSELIDQLLDGGAKVNQKNDQDYTALHLTLFPSGMIGKPQWEFNPKLFDLLIKKGADVNAITKEGKTPLYYAITNGLSTEIVKLLIARGADVNTITNNGETLLHCAANTCNVEILKLLIDTMCFNNADINSKNQQNNTALDILEAKSVDGSQDVDDNTVINAMDILINAGGTPGIKKFYIVGGIRSTIAEYLVSKMTPEQINESHKISGRLMLNQALIMRKPDVVKALLDKGPNPLKQDDQGTTALELAEADKTKSPYMFNLINEVSQSIIAAGQEVQSDIVDLQHDEGGHGEVLGGQVLGGVEELN